MKKSCVLLILTLSLASCQMTPSRNNSRSLANTTLLRTFISEVAGQSENLAAKQIQSQIDKRFKEFIRENSDNKNGNWVRMGITRDQAMKIESLSDDLPYMAKVHKWVMENMTTLVKEVKPSVAAKAYANITGKTGNIHNPYASMSDDAADLTASARNFTMPSHVKVEAKNSVASELKRKNGRLIAAVDEIQTADPNAIKNLKANLESTAKMIKENPLSAANIQQSLEGSLAITRKTGKVSVGPGCESFNAKASERVLELKSRVDQKWAELIEKRAYDKAGFEFKTVDEVPGAKRLTEKEIIEEQENAFSEVLGYTRLEARAAIKRLKNKPCRVY